MGWSRASMYAPAHSGVKPAGERLNGGRVRRSVVAASFLPRLL